MSILITSANSAQAYRLKNKLNRNDIILGDYHELPAFMLASGKMLQLPHPRSTSYTHEMLTLCLDHAIKAVYVLDSDEALLVAEALQLFKEYDIDIVISDEIQ